ncbi:MAG: 7-cyano-7-deazaguanine synthase QueC [Candidatus Neomarinimicrobiota bacterium]|jgi:7-cyano-7-deazaguanine synthase|nr:7-cyano-7-deazaguanine synthase QueC [Candidatus Neomarinimicrobiota bacterium]|tara:strand:- start:1755 stop:2438 length:684 start_codon:yes stop_codon:yes gene_type:complete
MNKKAVILLSGGLDSTTCLAIVKNQGFDISALTVNYGQRHVFELESAKKVAQIFDVNKHSVVDIDLAQFGGSALTDDVKVPKDRDESDMTDIPVTYVPARNTVLLSMALAWAETLDTTDIFIGVNALDYSGYPDCRPEFIESFERMANLATKMGVLGEKFKIHTPLINLTKAEIVKKGIELNVDYGMTSSCYDPNENGNPCGRCDACILRLKGFKEAGISDPLIYPD